MKNIFENAYFGKAYKTRDGRKALLWYYHVGHGIIDQAVLITTYKHQILVDGNGKEINEPYHETINDIVSEWTEPIDEEELDKLATIEGAKAISHFVNRGQSKFAYEWADLVKEAYKTGFRKAMEE